MRGYLSPDHFLGMVHHMIEPIASVAVIGGSGLYSLFDPESSEKRRIETPYGAADVTIGQLGGRTVAFLTRHGADHSVAPHLINYRANIWALASLGVKAILSSSAVGGVSPDYPPGTLVLTDQYIDRTHGRADTFFDGGGSTGGASTGSATGATSVQHLASADPFDPALHSIAAATLQGEGVRTSGTVVVIQGPRFSTRAESLWFRAAGTHTVNMTLYPEVPLAAELNIGTVNLSYVTDSDAGVADDEKQGEPLSAALVFSRLKEAQPRIVAAIEAIIRALPDDYAGRELIDPAEVAKVLDQGEVAQ
jgi:5'-methylthioadenosine phosphorylase